ncbi:hypothetical protein DKP78_18990, partial [Enterococcus faecium]
IPDDIIANPRTVAKPAHKVWSMFSDAVKVSPVAATPRSERARWKARKKKKFLRVEGASQ